jgi:UTP--glucose-1-phosphate uridylyltransferase
LVLLPDMITLPARGKRAVSQKVSFKHTAVISREEVPEETHQYGIVARGKDYGRCRTRDGRCAAAGDGAQQFYHFRSLYSGPEIFALLEKAKRRWRRNSAHRRHDPSCEDAPFHATLTGGP